MNDPLANNTKTAFDMALTTHRLNHDAAYARTHDGGLWKWSDTRSVWVQIDRDPSMSWE